jgi:hypothetical protein
MEKCNLSSICHQFVTNLSAGWLSGSQWLWYTLGANHLVLVGAGASLVPQLLLGCEKSFNRIWGERREQKGHRQLTVKRL